MPTNVPTVFIDNNKTAMASDATMTNDDLLTKVESPAERAERILKMCTIAEESRDRVASASNIAIKESESTNELTYNSPAMPIRSKNLCLPSFIESSNKEGNEACAGDIGDDSHSVAYTHHSTTRLSHGQLKEKLRQCQITLIKVKENSNLKYQRLQSEHKRMRETFETIESKVDSMKKKIKKLLYERDEAGNKATAIIETHHLIIQRVTDENDQLKEELWSLERRNQDLLNQKDEYCCMVEKCTCREIEMDEMNETSLQSNTQPDRLKRTPSISFSRRSLFNRRQSSQGSRRGSDYAVDWDSDGYLY